MQPSVVIKNLTKVFKKSTGFWPFTRRKAGVEKEVRAVDRVSLEVRAGEFFGLLGPNGAGKTTLIKCLATLLLPDAGTAEIAGFDCLKEPASVRRMIGLTIGGERTLYWKLSARDNLRYFAALYGMGKTETERRIDYLLELLDLKKNEHQRLEKYSSGMRQKVSFARAILHNPAVLLLDEPTLGLDPAFARTLREFMKERLNREMKKTIILTTHYMEEAEHLCDRIAIIHQGKIVVLDSPAALKKTIPFEKVLELKLSGIIKPEEVPQTSGLNKPQISYNQGISILRFQGDRLENIVRRIIELLPVHVKVLSVNFTEPTLEDVFIYLTGEQLKRD